MDTAFCSYHDSTSVSGRSFTLHPNASASATATRMAPYASLHCPMSMMRGRPPMVPKSRSLKRNLPQASVRIMLSSGACCTKSRK